MSPTGGAVGQVTVAEWPKLEAQIANLRQAQSYESLSTELDKLVLLLENMKRKADDAYMRMPQPNRGGIQAAPQRPATAPEPAPTRQGAWQMLPGPAAAPARPAQAPAPARQAQPKPMSQAERRESVIRARAAIAGGQNKEIIIRRLEDAGITDHGIK